MDCAVCVLNAIANGTGDRAGHVHILRVGIGDRHGIPGAALPEIYDFRVEDGVAKIECSPVASVEFISWRMPTHTVNGVSLTSAETKLPEGQSYVRASVIDEKGRRAWTNPIWL